MASPARERPILFSGEMVLAILDGRKTQTRRVVVPQPQLQANGALLFIRGDRQFQWFEGGSMPEIASASPFGSVGDRLWVRETFAFMDARDEEEEDYEPVLYRAERMYEGMQPSDFAWRWKPSIHMPRWASRLTLEITGVRVERLQDISDADVRAEGCTWLAYRCASEMKPEDPTEYSDLWDMLNMKRGYGWDVNPWVWVIEFRRLKA